jgi:diguanylate cyclase (GGDEF)-like protein
METLDESTGAFSWEAFAAFATVSLARASRQDGQASLLIVGPDPLPTMTTAAGLSLEATALLVLASAVLRIVRGGDIVGRYGPATFAILAQDASMAGAARLAERIQAAVPTSISSPHGAVPLSVSVGIASIPQAGTTLPELLRQAEHAFRAAVERGGNGIHLGMFQSTDDSWSSSLAAHRRDELARLMQAYERLEIEGIVIRNQPGACSVCLNASRDLFKPHLVPLPSLPLNGCRSTGGCRCVFSSPQQDPRRHPPQVPALSLGKIDIPRRLRDVAEFGGNPKKRGKAEELAEYLESFPLLPIESAISLADGERAYLTRTATRARLYPTIGAPGGDGLRFPFQGALRPWVEQAEKPAPLPRDSLLSREDGVFCLTNWRVLFSTASGIESILLVDVLDVTYLREGIGCQVAGERWRTLFLLQEPLLCGLYFARAIRDITLLAS